MLKKIVVACVLQGSTLLFAQDGILKVTVSDKTTRENLEAVSLRVESAGIGIAGGETNEKGVFILKNLAPGAYNVKFNYLGYQKTIVTGVLIKNHETTYLDVPLANENLLTEVTIEDYYPIVYEKPLIDPNTSIKTTFVHSEIENSVYTDVNQFVSSVGGAVQPKEGMTPHFRGCRTESVAYIIDGFRVTGSYGLPQGAIEQMSVTLGGVPAQYGDATGAFIEIETRSGLVNHNKK